MADPFQLQRFVDAQNRVYPEVCAELRQGRKRSHWMWFVFPQIKGLGHSALAVLFAISGRREAQAYLKHPVLGPRLRECTELVLAVDGRTIHDIFGAPDDAKFRSCMTLFAGVAGHEGLLDAAPFDRALQKYFAGERDPLTVEALAAESA